jgi:hypothetical protein
MKIPGALLREGRIDMGMYTELVIKAEVKAKALPDFRLLESGEDVHGIFLMSSHYHHPAPIINLNTELIEDGEFYVFMRIDLKNYQQEIEEFLEWLGPMLRENAYDDECVGWFWYEEWDRPQLLIVENGKIRKED